MNRLVRNIMTRHWADLEMISISCTTYFIYLSGTRIKTTKQDFRSADVDLIFQEIEKIPFQTGAMIRKAGK